MGQSVESEIYWNMNASSKRFQEKQDDQKWLDGEMQTDMVPLENITEVPIAAFIATDDHTCPHATAMEYIPRIGVDVTKIDVEGVDHDYFHSGANSDWFMTNLIA